jgi:DNA-binding XRE family transcriptional regulator
MNVCPRCEGAKVMFFAFRAGSIPCFFCKGAGEISNEQAGWVELGAKFRQLRLKQDLSTREMAKKLGISVVQLSDMELGKTNPASLFPNQP